MPKFLVLLGTVSLFLHTTSMAQSGCKDPAASNYSPTATSNDGSCTYTAVSRTPALKTNLAASLLETSGLIYWNNRIWTHNDGGNTTELFELDTAGNVLRSVNIANATNIDWEDIAQDDNYVYVGDVGNNASGNRQDLRVYRVAKTDLAAGNSVNAEIIGFQYADQTDFTALPANTTNFDCEAMIIYNGNVYLFTKQWTSLGTSVYRFPAEPGQWTAQKTGSNTAPAGLVTGADIEPAQRSIALCGYTSGGARFLYLLYDFSGTDFFSGNERYVTLNNIRQTEGIAFKNPEYIFLSSESLTRTVFGIPVTIAQALETVNLTTLLSPYYQLLPFTLINLQVNASSAAREIRWSVIPASEFHTGWLERRSSSAPDYQHISLLPASSGRFVDDDPSSMQEDVVYRIRAVDKALHPYFSREVKSAAPVNTTTVSVQHNTMIVRSKDRTPGFITIHNLQGQLMTQTWYQAEKQLDLVDLEKGVYIITVTGQDGRVRKRMQFLR